MNKEYINIMESLLSGKTTAGNTKIPAVLLGSVDFGVTNENRFNAARELQGAGVVTVVKNNEKAKIKCFYIVAIRDLKAFEKLGFSHCLLKDGFEILEK